MTAPLTDEELARLRAQCDLPSWEEEILDRLLDEHAALKAQVATMRQALEGFRIQHTHNCYRKGTPEEGQRIVLVDCHPACPERARNAALALDAGKALLDELKQAKDDAASAQASAAKMREAWLVEHETFCDYFAEYGAEHENENCPEDDTCECPLLAAFLKATEAMWRAVSDDAGRALAEEMKVLRVVAKRTAKLVTAVGDQPQITIGWRVREREVLPATALAEPGRDLTASELAALLERIEEAVKGMLPDWGDVHVDGIEKPPVRVCFELDSTAEMVIDDGPVNGEFGELIKAAKRGVALK